MIEIKNLTYGYKHTPVLTDFNLIETEPSIIALWGRNGTGKTTLMSLVAGHYKPNEGSIKVLGEEPYNNLNVLENICYIQENHPFGHNWRINDLLKYGRYFHPNWDQQFAEHLVQVFELPKNKKITKFSKGMKTAVQIILGLASNAKITVLDEPTNGLDAVKRKQFYDALMESYEENPRLILLSTHHIEEIQPLCETIVVVNDGKVLFHEQMEVMREKGVILSGNIDSIEEVTKNISILESSKISSTQKVMLDELYSNDWKKIAEEHHLTIEKATLQDYLINKTKNKEVKR
ncbi:multidrug ABC transporter ATP-binding protein [Bacillus sp. FJAT-25509]|uniref:ATP-binding cassette domain-containing protein n=1 Tax=Bacillaceae TaxID=186817 RepID=UPI0006F43DF4|nr:ABC transporter ATP-binding protein [Bacillus sp. FJAT-25509]KQL42087.1 multidrug ABC transporter ATP-binding protein [Bacillus sp. FJAT-25509]